MTAGQHRKFQETLVKTEVLIEALPFVKQYAGKRVVVKIGGELVDDLEAAKSFVEDITLLRSLGVKVVLVHGGGPQISRLMKQTNKEPVFINGQRVTDQETLELTSMVLLGTVNRTLVALLNAHGKTAVGVSGVDAQIFLCKPKNSTLGFVGEITHVSSRPILNLLDNGYLPVIASLGIDEEGNTYNINADTAAGDLAKAIKAEKYILLTNVEGLYESFGDKDSLISEIDMESLQKLLDSGTLAAGMIPKVESILRALSGSVPRAHILDGRVRHALLLEIFTSEGIGTMIQKENAEKK